MKTYTFNKQALRFGTMDVESKAERLFEVVHSIIQVFEETSPTAPDMSLYEKFKTSKRELFKDNKCRSAFSTFLLNAGHCLLVCHQNDLARFKTTYARLKDSGAEGPHVNFTCRIPPFRCACRRGTENS